MLIFKILKTSTIVEEGLVEWAGAENFPEGGENEGDEGSSPGGPVVPQTRKNTFQKLQDLNLEG